MSRLGKNFPAYDMKCRRWEDLQACSLVCREWLVTSCLARKSLTLQGGPQFATLSRFLSRFPGLLGVQLIGTRVSSDGTIANTSPVDLPLRLLVPSCRNLRWSILLYCVVVSDAGLATVLEGCKQLKFLRLFHCETVTGAAFHGFRCKALIVLDIDHCPHLTSEGLTAAAAACPNLSDLSVRWITRGAQIWLPLSRILRPYAHAW